MTGKKCTMAVNPSIVRIKELSSGLYDVQISDDIEEISIKRKNRETGELENTPEYSFTLYTGIVQTTEREKFISECIHIRYSIDDEIALIHKHSLDADNAEYTAYQNLRAAIKSAAAEYFSKEAA
ncbi:MAG: hypothetical protein ACI4A5_08990 [Hominilimicola sp.]